MDLIYMSDAMAYQCVRGPFSSSSYLDGRQWKTEAQKTTAKRALQTDKHQRPASLPCMPIRGKNNSGTVNIIDSKSKSRGGHHVSNTSGAGEVCRICQEQQRRTLRSYIRTKSHEEKDERCIVEEEDEDDGDNNRVSDQKRRD